MCGIAGILTQNPKNLSIEKLRLMTNIMSHRGPDGEGQWVDKNKKVGFGHRRLSILDLSLAGKQPMHYLNNRYTITFNGEIYNYLELKQRLLVKGYNFVSNSDTEVLMALYDDRKELCLQELDGMFAFAIWDAKEGVLFCARDRFGEKPFYYHYQKEESFYFASEMKALWEIGIPKNTNESMLFNYWFFNTIHDPDDLAKTFFQDIYSLEPGHYLKIGSDLKIINHIKYWDIDSHCVDDSITLNDAKKTIKELLFKSITLRMRSDVPIGSSLSGGLDSSTIVSIISKIKNSESQQKIFSARFPNFIKDESKYMDIVLQSIKADAFNCYPDENSMANNISNIIYHQEEPFGSASIAVQYEVMGLAKINNTTVILDGQGADEILCGYHGLVDSFFHELKRKNRKVYDQELNGYKTIQKDNNINSLSRRLRNNTIKSWLSNYQINALLGLKVSLTERRHRTIRKDYFEAYKSEQFNLKYKFESLNDALYYATMKGGLQELLRYADRNSMAHSREVRLPFLSHELVEYIFMLPITFKVHDGFTKYILREAVNEILPPEITWRKDKIGYEPPQKQWIDKLKVEQDGIKHPFFLNNLPINSSYDWKTYLLNKQL